MSKKFIHLLRHGSLRREDDGAIEFWKLKIIFRIILCFVIIGLTISGREAWQRGGGNKKIYQYCTDSSGAILYLRVFQGHPRRNLIDPSEQDNVVFPSGFFQYTYHVGCAINLHAIINSKTVFFTSVNPLNKKH